MIPVIYSSINGSVGNAVNLSTRRSKITFTRVIRNDLDFPKDTEKLLQTLHCFVFSSLEINIPANSYRVGQCSGK